MNTCEMLMPHRTSSSESRPDPDAVATERDRQHPLVDPALDAVGPEGTLLA